MKVRTAGVVGLLGLLASAGVAISDPFTEPPAPEPPRWTVVHCGYLLGVPGQAPLENAIVVIQDDRIQAVVGNRDDIAFTPGAVAPGSTVHRVDLRDKWVLPGLIDCHVHITHETSATRRLDRVTKTDAEIALDGTVYARKTLEAGFTTVRDVGALGPAVFDLRDAINAGSVVGPRVLAAGHAITPTGGHGDRTHGFRDGIFDIPGAREGIADGEGGARRAVRAQVKRGADLIKLTATGGVLSNTAAGVERAFFDDELEAIVATAHLLGRKVAAHAHGTSGINAALRAGVDSIEHGTYLDEESISLFKQNGAFLVPTITAGKAVTAFAGVEGYYTAPVMAKARRVGPAIQGAFANAYREGVRIAFGTDAGVFPHGMNALEFTYMVEAGMSPEDAIVSATLHAAELCGLTNEIGTVEVGKVADLIAVASDPREDIEQLLAVGYVMKSGRTIKDE